MRALIVMCAGLALVAAAVAAVVWSGLVDIEDTSTSSYSGEASIGGPFELVNGDGETVTDADFAGKPLIVYFGFTYCPDICPTELLAIADALDLLPAATAAKFQPLFITVDPERDTPDVVRDYVTSFHPNMIGLTGSARQIKRAASAYRVYYSRQETDDGPYTMAHSSYIYVMDGSGRYVRHFRMGTSPDEIAAALETVADPA